MEFVPRGTAEIRRTKDFDTA